MQTTDGNKAGHWWPMQHLPFRSPKKRANQCALVRCSSHCDAYNNQSCHNQTAQAGEDTSTYAAIYCNRISIGMSAAATLGIGMSDATSKGKATIIGIGMSAATPIGTATVNGIRISAEKLNR